MIRLVEALNYRCLKRVRQPLDSFQVLVGPNSSGKSSFLDVLSFLSRLASDGLEAAITERGSSIHDLFWQRTGRRFELAIEAVVPEDKRPPAGVALEGKEYAIRYEIAVGLSEDDEALVLYEQMLLSQDYPGPDAEPEYRDANTLFLKSDGRSKPWRSLIFPDKPSDDYTVIAEVSELKPDVFEVGHAGIGVYRDGNRPIFQGLWPSRCPTPIWLDGILRRQVVPVELSSSDLRNASRPGQPKAFTKTGSKLPWLVHGLQDQSPSRYKDWIAHVRQALPGVQSLRVIERPEDRYCYLMVQYTNGLEVPSWLLSDGTLRLLALTLIAYLPSEGTVYLIEEPETSIHPLNIEIVTQSLSSVYDGQVLAATHSPTVLSVTKPENVLVFSHDEESGTKIVRGSEHPRLRQWKGEPNLSVLYASGVLG